MSILAEGLSFCHFLTYKEPCVVVYCLRHIQLAFLNSSILLTIPWNILILLLVNIKLYFLDVDNIMYVSYFDNY